MTIKLTFLSIVYNSSTTMTGPSIPDGNSESPFLKNTLDVYDFLSLFSASPIRRFTQRFVNFISRVISPSDTYSVISVMNGVFQRVCTFLEFTYTSAIFFTSPRFRYSRPSCGGIVMVVRYVWIGINIKIQTGMIFSRLIISL